MQKVLFQKSLFNKSFFFEYWPSQVALVIKNSPANAGDIRDGGSIPGKIA